MKSHQTRNRGTLWVYGTFPVRCVRMQPKRGGRDGLREAVALVRVRYCSRWHLRQDPCKVERAERTYLQETLVCHGQVGEEGGKVGHWEE